MANKKKKSFVESQPEGALKGTFFDYIPDSMQMSNYLKQFMSKKKKKKTGGASGKAKGGEVRAMKLGGAVMKGRGPKFKGQS